MDQQFLADKLSQRTRDGNLRTLTFKEGLVDFVSNDYLGIAQNKGFKNRINELAHSKGWNHGSTGSRLLSGNYPSIEALETYLATLFKAEACLVFNSGYAANQALVSCIAEKGDTILYDQLSHVCLKEGAWLSKADTFSFKHNDLEDLESRISKASGKVFVLTETIFSMDGDTAPMTEIIDLCSKNGCYLIVDEAHSTGAYGENGAGMLIENEQYDHVFGRVYTFGKAIGAHGACVAGSKLLIDYLINFARPFIYTTAMSPFSAGVIKSSFDLIKQYPDLQSQLNSRIQYFRSLFVESISHTAIQPINMGSNEAARSASISLQNQGFDVRAILSPTVKRGSERLRVSLHAHNTDEELEKLCQALRLLV